MYFRISGLDYLYGSNNKTYALYFDSVAKTQY